MCNACDDCVVDSYASGRSRVFREGRSRLRAMKYVALPTSASM